MISASLLGFGVKCFSWHVVTKFSLIEEEQFWDVLQHVEVEQCISQDGFDVYFSSWFELSTPLKLLFLGGKQTVSHNRGPWEVSVFSDDEKLKL